MAPGKNSKQSDRKAAKASKKEDDEPAAASAGTGDIVERVKAVLLGSWIVQTAPKLQDLLQAAGDAKPKAAEEAKPEAASNEDKENEEKDANAEKPSEEKATNGNHDDGEKDPAKIFSSLCSRLTWYNALGLGDPVSGEDAKKAWIALKGLEIDFGPRAKRKGNPGFDRIKSNFHNNLPQYLHVLLALMMLQALVFRSWFACLPWLVGYQVVSTLVPLAGIPQLPQVPVEKCPPQFRVIGTFALHALVWLFFLYDVLWRSMILTFPAVGIFVYHAYAARPVDQ